MFHRFSHKRTCWKLMFSILCLFKNVNSRCHRHKLDLNWFLFLRDVGFRETASVEWVCNVLTLRQILWFEEENMERKLGGKRIKERESEKRKLGKNICSMYLSLSLSLSVSICLCLSISLSLTHTYYTVHTQKLGSVDNIESNKAIVVNVCSLHSLYCCTIMKVNSK